ncbi:hypothetical protein IQ252_27795 [Tychonema sp. LEGE 07203]|nr:hypothetical protein [Tychonema sp. LEGE 07203]
MRQVKELRQHELDAILGRKGVQYPWYTLGNASIFNVAHGAVHVCKTTGMYEIKLCFGTENIRC